MNPDELRRRLLERDAANRAEMAARFRKAWLHRLIRGACVYLLAAIALIVVAVIVIQWWLP